MARVAQIRAVPDEALMRAACAQGLSLTKFLLRELEQIADRARRVEDNARVIRETQRQVGGDVDRPTILAVLRDGRRDEGSRRRRVRRADRRRPRS